MACSGAGNVWGCIEGGACRLALLTVFRVEVELTAVSGLARPGTVLSILGLPVSQLAALEWPRSLRLFFSG